MRRREFVALVGGAVAWPLAAHGQQSGKVYKIGILSAGAAPPSAVQAILPSALRELGWEEGKHVAFERRYAENSIDRLDRFAAELVDQKVDVIVAAGTLAPLAAKRATITIPIVMTSAGDPLGSKLVESLARPGGNVTGMSLMVPDIGGKRLEIMRELSKQATLVGVIWNTANPYPGLVFRETERAAETLGVKVRSLAVKKPGDFPGAFDLALQQQVNALAVVEDPLTYDHHRQIAEFAAGHSLPSISGLKEFVQAGGLLSYGADVRDLVRRSAAYVDKILKGAKPTDLPVEQPTKFELVINLKTANALGITIPPTLLARADEVIE